MNGEATTGPVGSTIGVTVVVNVSGGGGVPEGHPLPGEPSLTRKMIKTNSYSQ